MRAQYLYYPQELQTTAQSYHREIDEVADQAQALTKVSSEARVTMYVSQLTDRYDILMKNVKVSEYLASLSPFQTLKCLHLF